MGELTKDTQKCVLPIDGSPILCHILDELTTAFGVLNLILAVSYKAADVKKIVDNKLNKKNSVKYIYHKEGSESAAAYLSVKDQIKKGETILGIPGDVIATSCSYFNTLEQKTFQKVDIVVTSSTQTDEVNTHPLVLPHESSPFLVKEFIYPVKDNISPEGYLRDMSIFSFDSTFFDTMVSMNPDLYGLAVSALIPQLANCQRAGLRPTSAKWLHVGYPSDLNKHWKGNNEE